MINLKRTIFVGAFALGATGCGLEVNNSRGSAVVTGIEEDAVVVQPLNGSEQYRIWSLMTNDYQVGDTINPNYLTEGKQIPIKGGN
ncbi:MAG TPA: hypothetical protein VJH92_05475 [Candidatus Nanoarchaeia archaeon]|nr:hypothetical protein [Candidatus Nanoarchaeia archaeon]